MDIHRINLCQRYRIDRFCFQVSWSDEIQHIVVGVMKIRYIAPREGIEHTSLAFRVIVLTALRPMLPDVTTLPTPTSLYSSLPQRSMQTTTIFRTEALN